MFVSVANELEKKTSMHICYNLGTQVSNPIENAASTTTITTAAAAVAAAAANSKSPKRLITNLKDFSRLAKTGSSSEDRSEPCLTVGSSTDDFEDDDDNDDLVNYSYIQIHHLRHKYFDIFDSTLVSSRHASISYHLRL